MTRNTTHNMRLPVEFKISPTRVITGDGPTDSHMSYSGVACVFGTVVARAYDKRTEAAAIRALKDEIKARS